MKAASFQAFPTYGALKSLVLRSEKKKTFVIPQRFDVRVFLLVLPALCILCQRVEKHITVRGKPMKDQLTLAEMLSAGLEDHKVSLSQSACD